jgi:hypothetical protein
MFLCQWLEVASVYLLEGAVDFNSFVLYIYIYIYSFKLVIIELLCFFKKKDFGEKGLVHKVLVTGVFVWKNRHKGQIIFKPFV